MSAHTHRAKRNRTRVRVCISPQHARVSTQKHTITELTHQNKMFPQKKKCTLQHQYALLMVVVVAVSACTRRHNKYTHQHSTHIRTSGMYAPVAKQNKTPAPVQTKYAHQHRTHTRRNKKRKKVRTTHKCTLQHQYTRAWRWCACVCLRSMHAPVQKQNTSTSTNKIRSPAPHSEQIKKSKKKCTLQHQYARTSCVCVCVRMSVCVSAQHAHTSTKKYAHRTTLTHKKKNALITKKKEKCTLQHQYARTWWCCACVRAHVCVYICGMHAPVAKQNTSTALTYQTKKENAHSSSSMHAPGAYVRVCLRLDLLLTPAPVSACGGGGVCLWLAFLFRFVGALCIMCGVCVFLNVSGHLFTG